MRLVQAHTSAGSERLGSLHAFRLGIPVTGSQVKSDQAYANQTRRRCSRRRCTLALVQRHLKLPKLKRRLGIF